MPFLVDNSVVVGWYYKSQPTNYSDQVLDLLAEDTAHVPALWLLVFCNVLRKTFKAGNLNMARLREILDFVQALRLSVDCTAEDIDPPMNLNRSFLNSGALGKPKPQSG